MKDNKLSKLILGFIFSLIFVGYLSYLSYILYDQVDILEELSFYFQSIGEHTLSDQFINGYYFFNNIMLFSALLLIPIIRLLNNAIFKNIVFYYQFGLILFIAYFIFNYNEIIFDINFTKVLSTIIYLVMIIYFLEKIVKDVKGKQILPHLDLNPFEIIYYLLLIVCSLVLPNKLNFFSGLLGFIVLFISLLALAYVPYRLIKRINIKSFKLYKPMMLFLVSVVFLLAFYTSYQMIKYSNYSQLYPDHLILNKNTAFRERKGELVKNCEDDRISCTIWNDHQLFNEYDFDTATIKISKGKEDYKISNIDSENKIELILSNINHKGTLNLEDNIIVDEFQLIETDTHYSIKINLNKYLNQYEIKDYKLILIGLDIIDAGTNESIPIKIADYEMTLKKIER